MPVSDLVKVGRPH